MQYRTRQHTCVGHSKSPSKSIRNTWYCQTIILSSPSVSNINRIMFNQCITTLCWDQNNYHTLRIGSYLKPNCAREIFLFTLFWDSSIQASLICQQMYLHISIISVNFSTCLFVNPKLSNLTWQYCSSTGNLPAYLSHTKIISLCLYVWQN